MRNPPHKATVDTKSDRHKAIMTGVRMGTGAAPHDVMSNGSRSKDEGRRDSEDTRDESDESEEELEVYSKDQGELNLDHTYFNLDLVTFLF
jgi:hypothetical protein